MFRSSSWVALYTLLIGALGVLISLQLGALVGTGRAPALNPLIGLMEVVFGRVKGTWLTWLLLILTGIGCLVFYALLGETPSDKSYKRKNELMNAHALEATAKKKNLSTRSRLAGLTVGTIIGLKSKVIQNWETVGIFFLGPRMGKTSGFIVRHALEAPGAFLFTSNKYDGVAEIAAARGKFGKVWIFDTEGLLPYTRKQNQPLMRWDFIGSINSRSRAEAYSKILNDSFKLSEAGDKVSSDAFFEPLGKKIVLALLMTAHRGSMSVLQMMQMINRNDFDRLILILEAEYPLLSEEVRRVTDQPGRTKENILAVVNNILTALSNDEVIGWLDPIGAEPTEIFDPRKFVKSRDTLIILVKDGGSSAATLSSLLVEAVFDAAVDEANPRLDPPLVCDLDEINNTVHLKTLPLRYTYFGSRGIIVNAYLQTYSSARRLWGEDGFKTIKSAATLKVVGGGIDEAELNELAKMLGTYEKKTTSVSSSRSAGASGRDSISTSRRKEEIVSASELGNLPPFTSVVRVSGVGKGLVDIQPWFKDDQLQKKVSTKEVEATAQYLGYSLGHFDGDTKPSDEQEIQQKKKKERFSLV